MVPGIDDGPVNSIKYYETTKEERKQFDDICVGKQNLRNWGVTVQDIRSLQSGKWLSGGVIDAYLESVLKGLNITKDIRLLSSDVYPSLTRTRSIILNQILNSDLLESFMVVLPICIKRVHWVLAAIYPVKKTIMICDAQHGNNETVHSVLFSDIMEICKRKRQRIKKEDWYYLSSSEVSIQQWSQLWSA